MKTKTPKTPKITAQKFWKSASGSYLYPDKKSAQYFSGFEAPKIKPVVVLPADKTSFERMVEQMAKAMHEENKFYQWGDMEKFARAALASIGITKGRK